MATVDVQKLSPQELAELACTYSALILYDDGQDITGILWVIAGEKIGKLISAAGVKVESFWPKLFAKALDGKDISSFFNFGGVAPSAGSSAPVAATPATAAPAADKKGDEKGKKK